MKVKYTIEIECEFHKFIESSDIKIVGVTLGTHGATGTSTPKKSTVKAVKAEYMRTKNCLDGGN